MLDTHVRSQELASTKPSASADPPSRQAVPPLRIESLKIVTFPARIFLALGWLRAGTEKLIDVNWWTGVELNQFLTEQRAHALPFMRPLIDLVFVPGAVVIAAVVMALQFAVGAALVTGRRLQTAIVVGMTLNVTFVAMGVVTPSAFYLVLQLTLLAALGERRVGEVGNGVRWMRIAACVGGAASMLPLVATLHPDEVIDDPALMLATVALLCASVDALRIIQVHLATPH